MDAEKLLKALTAQENQEVAAALPADIFAAEAARRGFATPEAAGSLAVEAVVSDETDAEAVAFKTDLNEFVASNTQLSAAEQLNTMGEFWGKLGLIVPALNEEQLEKIQAKLEAHPERRALPVPLLDFSGLKAVVQNAKSTFPDSKFGSYEYEALWMPGESSIDGKLLRDPETTVKDGRKSYGLRYHTEDGVLSRSELVDKLKSSGQAVEANDGTVWLFPVMDVQVESPRDENARADKLHRDADITQTPETLITMQLLHQANGTPNPNWHVDFTNEGIYELDKKGNPVAPVRVAGVYWHLHYLLIDLNSWSAGFQCDRSGVRGAESGL